MLLGRSTKLTGTERLQAALWPACGWRRSLRYARLRLGRLQASPHAVGLGLAVGVFAAFQPILGFQMLAAAGVAVLLRASLPAALIGTFVGGPLTWPFMWFASYEVGSKVLGVERSVTLAELWNVFVGPGATASPVAHGLATTTALFREILRPLAVGALPLGLMAAMLAYALAARAMVRIGQR